MSRHSKTEVSPPYSEMLKSVPAFLGIRLDEEPFFNVIHQEGVFEVRQYPHLVVAELSMKTRPRPICLTRV